MIKKIKLDLYEINGNNVKEIKNKRVEFLNYHQSIKVYDRDSGRTLYLTDSKNKKPITQGKEVFVACYDSERIRNSNGNSSWSKMKEGYELFIEAADHVSRKAIVREVVYIDEPRRLVVLDYLIHGDYKKVVFIAPPQGPGIEVLGIGWIGISSNPKKLVRIHKLKDELNKNLEDMELLEKRNLEIIKELHINGIEI